jgi:hypothetical protein
MRLVILLAAASVVFAQDGQQQNRPGWPCVPGRAVDPVYVENSESTGGQLFLFQKGEIEHAGPVMAASFTHPSTVARAVGHLSGSRTIDFPVDSTIESLFVMISVQCRAGIALLRPNGAEMIAANTARAVDLKAGKIVQVDAPEAGMWRVRVEGTGLYVVSVQAKSSIKVTDARFSDEPSRTRKVLPGVSQNAEIHLPGPVANVKLQVVGAGGEPAGDPISQEEAGNSVYKGAFTP